MDFTIRYNPYLVETDFIQNGINLSANESSKFSRIRRNKRLQEFIGESSNWDGLLEEIKKSCNSQDINLMFHGRRIDFNDLELFVKKYAEEGKPYFQLKHENAQNDNDIISSLDELFDEVKRKLKEPDLPAYLTNMFTEKDIFTAYEEVKNGLFEVNVIATMSSGKSTLLNALLGTELLPAENQACTAQITEIVDDDSAKGFIGSCYADMDRKTVIHPQEELTADRLKQYNSEDKVRCIAIKGNIPLASSNQLRLLLRDTPGPNNSQTTAHRDITYEKIDNSKAVVLYVLNATQLKINDDKELLRHISEKMKESGQLSHDRFIFVVNKCDALDDGKGESAEKIVKEVKTYLESFGITDSIIIPTSAYAALILRKQLAGEPLTRKEKGDVLNRQTEWIDYSELHYEEHAVLTPTVREKLEQDLEQYHKAGDTTREALIHTGIPAVEAVLNEYVEKYAYPIKIHDAVKNICAILRQLDMEDKFKRKIAGDEEYAQKVQEQLEKANKQRGAAQSVRDTFDDRIRGFQPNLDEKNARNEVFRGILELTSDMTEYLKDGQEVDKAQADKLIKDFVDRLSKFQLEYRERIRNQITEKLTKEGSDLLEKYQAIVREILGEIPIDGYQFENIAAINDLMLPDIESIVSANTKDRYREETRWKKNPKRAGFWGVFKFWQPAEISYTVQVKDGKNVNVLEVVRTLERDFSKIMEDNIKNMMQQAKKQIEQYKETFYANLIQLDAEIKKVLKRIAEYIMDKKKIEEELERDKALLEWTSHIKRQFDTLLSF